jgi:subtilisin family serine protease
MPLQLNTGGRLKRILLSGALLLGGCGRTDSPLQLKTKIAAHNVRLATSENVEAWLPLWDRKTFIVGMTEQVDLSTTDARIRAQTILAGAIIRYSQADSILRQDQLSQIKGIIAAGLNLERQVLHADAQLVSDDTPDNFIRDGAKISSPERLGIYFIKLSDVGNALSSLHNFGVADALRLRETVGQIDSLRSLMNAFNAAWPVEWVEPNLVGYLKPWRTQTVQESALGLAPEFKYNTSIVAVLKRMRADSAYSFVEKSRQSLPAVNVAILDTGVDSSHPELKDQMFVNSAEKADGQDNDSNCFVDDVHGIDATSECGRDDGVDPKPGHADLGGAGKSCPRIRPNDELSANCGHGSHVAGIVAAKHGGDLSTMGICPSCRILSIRVAERCLQPDTQNKLECVKPTSKFDPLTSYEVDGGISDSSQIRALTYLYNLRAPDNPGRLLVNVVNLSLGKYFASRTMSYIIRNLQRKNIIVVAAAGNDGTETPSYPAAYDSVVSVCATSEDYSQGAYGRAPFSNFGDWVDICAPGTDIVSTIPGKTSDGGGLFVDKSGTSQATPFVAGALGYLLAYNGNTKSAAQIIELLKNAADSETLYNSSNNRVPGSDERLYRACYTDTSVCDNLLGAGFLDLDAAIQGKRQSKTNFNFLANQPGGCIVGSLAFAQRAGGRVTNAFGSTPALLILVLALFRIFRLLQRSEKKAKSS